MSELLPESLMQYVIAPQSLRLAMGELTAKELRIAQHGARFAISHVLEWLQTQSTPASSPTAEDVQTAMIAYDHAEGLPVRSGMCERARMNAALEAIARKRGEEAK